MIWLVHSLLRSIIRLLSLPLIASLNFLLLTVFRGRRLRITVMDPRLFGHQSLEPEVFWDDWKSAIEAGSRDIWFCCLGKKSNASNEYLWNLRYERFPTLPSWFVTSIVRWKRFFHFSAIELLEPSISRVNCLTRRDTTLPNPETMAGRRLEILGRLREPARPYVVLTVREYDFTRAENELRNRPIADFIPAIRALSELGYNIVRLTSQTRDPLMESSGHVLDWQVRRLGQPGDELAIISGAAFVVSTTTGGDALALAYRRPVMYLDCARLFITFLATELATFQMPTFLDASTRRNLKFVELLDRGLGWVGEQRAFFEAGVTVINSTPDEIRDLVVDYHERRLWVPDSTPSVDEIPWREMILSYHRDQVQERFGSLKARMHPATKKVMLDTE